MPQSWPSQWTLLFMLFIMVFLCVVVLSFFAQVSTSPLSGSGSLKENSPNLIWEW